MSSDDDNHANTTFDIGPVGYEIVGDIKKVNDGSSREIGERAVWSVSSCKQGYGVTLLRDDNLESYWQSDGTQPHMVNVQFRQKTDIGCVAIYTDYKSDESYTPSRVSFRVGNHYHDLREIEQIYMQEPCGWVVVKLQDKIHQKPIRAFILQVAILQNHQNGRDTHLRQIKVFSFNGIRKQFDPTLPMGLTSQQFSTVECSMFNTIR
uniref:anaphase-promoting complex subunit 10-like n=1 Tax=Styela clava TaxID=7725 RepID=UPI001939CE67|nr:anaphase-promoting complex subunit 10-like [Styela clava]XP_039251041.1 anaphase-promoting complex subunit 10-like [Styela clava]